MRKLKLCIFSSLFSISMGGNSMAHIMTLESAAFSQGGYIPSKYTCDGANISPPLQWGNVPVGTKSFALIMDDPDAPRGVWVHWIVHNIPSTITFLEENGHNFPSEAVEGVNSWSKSGYGGPCPPEGTHRYRFQILALDGQLTFPINGTKEDILKTCKGHILGDGNLMGLYARSK